LDSPALLSLQIALAVARQTLDNVGRDTLAD